MNVLKENNKIIHFCSYFFTTQVYTELFKHLSSNSDISQTVYVPCKVFNENVFNKEGIDFKIVKCLSLLTRFFYFLKIILILFFAIRNIGNQKCLIHAHTLYSDGIPGYLYSLVRGGELVISIRGTDVSLGFRFYRHYKWLARLALKRASKVIFISPCHKKQFNLYFGDKYDSKLEVIPNGVNDFFIKNSKVKKTVTDKGLSALYIGSASRNKNIYSAIHAFFTDCSPKEKFYIVGCDYQSFISSYGELDNRYKSSVCFLGKKNMSEIIDIMEKSSLFIMPSLSETFGLVYIESISQCLPIIYSEGQGVDGYFTNGQFGFKCNPKDINSIKNAVYNTLSKFPCGLGPFEHNPALDFCWHHISKKYLQEIYQ